jgi:pyruvate kinase
MRRHRRTRVVATFGPASSSPEMLGHPFQAGADAFRLNFSHGTHEDQLAPVNAVLALEHSVRRPIGILADIRQAPEGRA